MANINRVVLVGNLTRDPELRHTPSGTAVCKLRIAVNTRQKDQATGEWGDKPNYFDVTVWGNQGESCAQFLAQGPSGRRSTAGSTGASGTPRTARSARPSRSSPTASSSSAAGRTARAAQGSRSSCPRARSAATPTSAPPAPTTTSRSRRATDDGTAERTRARRRKRPGSSTGPIRRKSCYFCKEKIDEVDYKNVNQLRRYISEKGKIRNRRVTGACRRHQRQVAVAIKRAREMALLPYVVGLGRWTSSCSPTSRSSACAATS